MAFGKKYYSSYKSNNNLDYYLEIFVEDYSSTSSELTMGAGGPVIEYETDQEDRFSPIISSSCKIPFLVKDNTDATFIDSLRTTYQERQIYVHLYRSDSSGYSSVSPLWSGFLVMDLGKGVDQSFPYVQELKFVDGLALLKDIDFVDLSDPTYEDRVQGNYVQENMYYGPGTYIFWIREILLKSGAALTTQGATENYRFTTSINWYNGDMDSAGQSDDPLQKTKCQVSMFHRKDDKDVYFPDNCYNVLKELLRHWGARITYWKHQFWIVQIPEYITGESGTLDNPQNNNSRVYTYTGALQGTQDHLGSTYWTRYFQEISNTKISKLTGTTYDYLPIIKQVNADFLSFASENKFGGLPFGSTAPTQEVFQGTINTPSAADFLFLSIPLDWQWDLSNAPNFPSGHTNGWWASIKFNFYASDGSTTYYLQYNSQSQTLPYFWVDSASWSPLGNRSPKYTISSKQITVNGHVGFEEQIPFKDANGNAIVMSGAWSFFLDIEDYGTSSSNPGSFYLNFSGYGSPQRMRNPGTAIQLPLGSGNLSGTVSWSNTLQDPQGNVTISSITNPAGFNAGTVANDIRFATTSPFLGLLQLMTNTQSAAYGESYNTMNTSSTAAQENSEQFDFGTLLWGDVTDEFARSSLQVYDGSTYENTNQSGLWGRGTLLGTKTFTQLLIDEFLYGQTKIVITPNMRLAVGEANKNQTQGAVTRPRYVNPIGKLRETRDGADPEYFFRRGSFYTLLDEWDYEGYQILRNVVTTTTQTNGMGNRGGTQANTPNQQAMIQNPVVQALAQNSPIAYLRETVNATGSDVAVNGNFNVATGWTLGTGWTIDTTEKVAKFAATGSTSDLVQSVLTQELTYQVNFRVVVTAGTLTVKAGTSGDTQVISSSGDYSIYLTCEGSNDIKFQAGTTFTGNITFITLRDQKSLTSLPIEEIGSAVFKTGDTFNLINENEDQPLVLTVTADQGSTDTTISVSSTPLYEDITPNSYLLINQDDLSAQYQNKTKGTVGGFDITATSIDSGSVAISSYIDDDTFATASATSLATSESIKAYVDPKGEKSVIQIRNDEGITIPAGAPIYSKGEIGGSERILVGISDAGDSSKMPCIGIVETELNTTDNKDGFATTQGVFNTNISGFTGLSEGDILYVNSGSPPYLTQTKPTNGDLIQNVGVVIKTNGTVCQGLLVAAIGRTNDVPWPLYVDHTNQRVGIDTSSPIYALDVNGNFQLNGEIFAASGVDLSLRARSGQNIIFKADGTEKMRLTSTGLGIGTSSPSEKLQVTDGYILASGSGTSHGFELQRTGLDTFQIRHLDGNFTINNLTDSRKDFVIDGSGNVGINQNNPTEKLHVVGNSLVTGNSHADAFKPAISGNPIKFKRYDGNEVGRFKNNGYFGINVSDPQRSLDIGGAVRVLNENQIEWGWGGVRITGSVSTNTFKIGTWGGSSVVDRMTVTSSGNVLIGTTTDNGDKLQIGVASSAPSFVTDPNVAATIASTTNGDEVALQLFVNDGTNNIRSKYFVDDTELLAGFDVTYSSGLNGFAFKMIGSEKMRLSTAGNLLLGTTSDSGYKLTVNGDIKLNDNAIRIGSSSLGDLKIYHSTNSFIQNDTGDLYISQTANDKDIIFQSDDGSGGIETYFFLDGSTGRTIFPDNKELRFGTGSDLNLYHDGSNSYVVNNTGDLLFYNNTDDGDIKFYSDNGSGGTTEYFRLDGSVGGGSTVHTVFPDNSKAVFGTGLDTQIWHNGTNSYIKQQGGGDLIIQQTASDKDIILQSDDGFGGETAYITLDGSQTTINLQKTVLIGTTTNTGSYKIDVAGKQRVQDTLELDDVLMLNAISTPSDPAAGKSVIYMDSSDGGIKCKINVEGTVVTRTIASFE